MNAIERSIWTATFSNVFALEWQFKRKHIENALDSIDGFTCAEIADVAVEKYREVLKHPDADSLMIKGEDE